jgi:hypothetical protein
VATVSFSQNRKKIQRSWIKTTATSLTGKEPQIVADTLYTRYTFDGSNLFISFYPAWDTYKQEWSMEGDQLIVGPTIYLVEALTDTSLIIVQPGFRRTEFLTEEYISSQDKHLVSLGEHNGKPLYQANKQITPRYLKHISFYDKMREGLELGNLTQPDKFQVTFIVTEEGKVENVQLVKGMAPGHDKDVMERIQKTSKNWKPAYFKGQPIQTQLLYEVKFLPSIVPGGRINRPGLRN